MASTTEWVLLSLNVTDSVCDMHGVSGYLGVNTKKQFEEV